MSVKLQVNPSYRGIGKVNGANNKVYTIAADGTVVVDNHDVPAFLAIGFTYYGLGISGTPLNGLGDSITVGGNTYQSSALPSTYPTVLPWTPGENVTNLNSVRYNGNNIYQCIQSGTCATSGGPTGTGNNITDNGAKWTYVSARAVRNANSFLALLDKISGGTLNFDMSIGYDGVQGALIKILVIAGGKNYTSADTVTCNNGAKASLVIGANGAIAGVNVLDGGGSNGSVVFTATINSATGSGAVLSVVANPSGTFGVGGCFTQDMVARLPDVFASRVRILTILGGINDITANLTPDVIFSNLRNCYDTVQQAGILPVAICITPCAGLTQPQMDTLNRVNRAIRAYCSGESWANPNKLTNIALADPTQLLSDGTGAPIGGAGGVVNAVTNDGKHLNPRGNDLTSICIYAALQKYLPPAPPVPARADSYLDGYDPIANPTGNVLEGRPWVTGTTYSVIGMLVTSDTSPVKQYRLKTPGVAGATAPTGTGSTISDGGAVWAYVAPVGVSVFGSGTGGTFTAATGITFVGNMALGWTLARTSGSASGTITSVLENPYSDGRIAPRLSLNYNLYNGTVNEQWSLTVMNGALPFKGITAADGGQFYFGAEADIEISNVANAMAPWLRAGDSTDQYFSDDGFQAATLTAGMSMMASNGEALPIANNGKRFYHTQPMLMPAIQTAQTLQINFGFDASGTNGNATMLAKINFVALRKKFIL